MVADVEDVEGALAIEETPISVGVVAGEEVDEGERLTEAHQEKDQPHNVKTMVRSSPNDSSKSV